MNLQRSKIAARGDLSDSCRHKAIVMMGWLNLVFAGLAVNACADNDGNSESTPSTSEHSHVTSMTSAATTHDPDDSSQSKTDSISTSATANESSSLDSSGQSSTTSEEDSTTTLAMCELVADPSDCGTTAVERWTYDAASDRCFPFRWQGCGADPYASVETCKSACKARSLTANGRAIEQCSDEALDQAAVTLLTLRKKNEVQIDYEVSGGCRADDFARLCWSGIIAMKDGGKRVKATLIYDGQGDSCKALESKQNVFDLEPLLVLANGESLTLEVGGQSVILE